MNKLLLNRLVKLQPGTPVEFVRSSDGHAFRGTVTENDSEEALAIEGEFGELVLMYSEVKTFVVLQELEPAFETPQAPPVPADDTQPVQDTSALLRQPEPVRAPAGDPFPPQPVVTRVEKLSFFTDVRYPQLTDAELETFYREKLSAEEKRLSNSSFQSYKYRLRNREFAECAFAVRNMVDDFDDMEYASDDAYRFTLDLQARAQCEPDESVMTYISAFDYLAVRLYLKKDHHRAAACACIALARGCEGMLENAVYTILAVATSERNDTSGLIYVLTETPALMYSPKMQELIAFIYTKYQYRLPALLDTATVIGDLNTFCRNAAMSIGILAELDRHAPKDHEEKKVVPVDPKPTPEKPKLKPIVRNRRGEIFYLSWADAWGKVLADGTEYRFSYGDVEDKDLLQKIKGITTRDLRAIGSVFNVTLTESEGKVSQIREDFRAVPKPQPAPDNKRVEFVVNVPGLTSLKMARQVLKNDNNDRRYEESLSYFEKAMEEEADPAALFAEYLNTVFAAVKRGDTEALLQRAYGMYDKYREQIGSSKLSAFNMQLYDLLVRLQKPQEAIEAVGRILSDPKLAPETRLYYIFARAKQQMEIAANLSLGDTAGPEEVREAYANALSSYMDWEQRFSAAPSIKNDPNQKKTYYNIVLVDMAKCLVHTDDIEKARELLNRALAFDPANETARVQRQVLINTSYGGVDPDEAAQPGEAHEPAEQPDELAEEEAEEQVRYVEYRDVSGWDALGIDRGDAAVYAIRLIAENKTPAAVAYLKAASALNPALAPLYDTVSYASNQPMETLNYLPEDIALKIGEYPDAAEFTRRAQAAAFLRGAFYHSAESAYFNASSYVDREVFEALPALGLSFQYIDQFRAETGKGMDLYADYRNLSDDSRETALAQVLEKGRKLYDKCFGFYRETAYENRYKITRDRIFVKDGLHEHVLQCVMNNDLSAFGALKEEFTKLFIRAGSAVAAVNIDMDKINSYIDDNWAAAGRVKGVTEPYSNTLTGSLRSNLRITLVQIAETACEWLSINAGLIADLAETGPALYASLRAPLLSALSQTLEEIGRRADAAPTQEKAGLALIADCVRELTERLEGTWKEDRRRYFFADFLRTDRVLLNEDLLPDLTFTFCDLPAFNILARIRAHAESAGEDLPERAAHIFSRDAALHDFGSAKQIADYLAWLGRQEEWSLPDTFAEFDEQAKKQLRDCYDNFTVDLGAAFCRGQIDPSNTFLKTCDETAQSVYQYCVESGNYGFFFRFAALCRDMIRENAKEYAAILEKQLMTLAEKKKMEDADFRKISAFIETQQFTVVEEMMDQYAKLGYIPDDEYSFMQITDYLDLFWQEFEAIYSAISRDRGNSLVRIVSSHGAARDRRGGEDLVNNWPRSGCTADQINRLLTLLGWNEISVEKAQLTGIAASFHVKQSARVYSQREYAHPIAAFGTEAHANGFYVCCLFGTTDGERLIDICKRLDDAAPGNKILLVDFALSAAERRRLSRLMKQVQLANAYMIVDRVSLLFLANHFAAGVGEQNSRTLFAISMPFTYYQPYVLGSTTPTAPELFRGRKTELVSVESPQGANLIYGGRQLGKTAILKKAANETHDPENGRYAFVIDLNGKTCAESARKISRELIPDGVLTPDQETDSWEDLAFYLRRNIIEKSMSYFLLMLDEADAFIDDCKHYAFAPIAALKDIQQSTNGRFKFVLAGLHNVVRFKRDIALGNNSVIAHLTDLNVKPFDYPAAKSLLQEPLSYLGFVFSENDEAIREICSATNYYPGLLQLFGNKLLESMRVNYGGYNEAETPSYPITPRQIGRLLSDPEFKKEIRDKFEITLRLDDKEGNYYYVIALLLAMLYDEKESAEGYSVSAILDMAKAVGVEKLQHLKEDHVNAILEELCDLNILRRIDENFAFRTRSFRDLLGSRQELEDKLLELISKPQE